jgi:hypothetical protein
MKKEEHFLTKNIGQSFYQLKEKHKKEDKNRLKNWDEKKWHRGEGVLGQKRKFWQSLGLKDLNVFLPKNKKRHHTTFQILIDIKPRKPQRWLLEKN